MVFDSLSDISFSRSKVLLLLKTVLNSCTHIVEAGAFNGSDTKRMATQWPTATVHAFEPLPEAYVILREKTARYLNIHTYPLALGTHTGSALFYVSQKASAPHKPFKAGTLSRPTGRLQWSNVLYRDTITVKTTTLNDWMKMQKVSHIDLFWLDVQGYAMSILQASESALAHIQYLYVELEHKPAYETYTPLNDALAWLSRKGFDECGRRFTSMHTWFYGNILLKNRNFGSAQ